MKQVMGIALILGLIFASQSEAADESKAVIDKAVKALGGAGKLDPAKTLTWNAKGKLTYEGNDNEFTSKTTIRGLDHFRQEFAGEFGGNRIEGVTVLDGDKGWRKFGDEPREMNDEAIGNQKRTTYLQQVGALVLPLKEKGFKVESTSEESVGKKPAVALKATGPDGKDFQLFFDKDSGLPVKLVAKVADFRGEEYTQETTFSNYKEFDGVKRATRVEHKRDGERFIELDLADFKVLDKADKAAFAKP